MTSFFTSTSKMSWFIDRIICIKLFMEKEQLVGEIKLFDDGISELLETLNSEVERVEALRRFFGVRLSEAEVLGIRGMLTEIT